MNLPVRRAAIAQLCSTNHKLYNLECVAKVAGLAKREGAAMLFLPECFGFMGSSAAQTLENAEPIDINTSTSPLPTGAGGLVGHINDGERDWILHLQDIVDTGKSASTATTTTTTRNPIKKNENISILRGLRAIAQKSGLWISGGGMHESGAPPAQDDEFKQSRVYNTHVIIDSNGQLVTKYRKIHLFDVSIPSKGVNLRESATTAPGTELIMCDNTPLGSIGLSTCYDVRFPELYMQYAERGADIILVPSAFTVPTGEAHWHTLLRARAIENQCYILASAQFGQHNEKRKSYGHSVAIDPWGTIIADAGGYDGPGTTCPTTTCNPDDDDIPKKHIRSEHQTSIFNMAYRIRKPIIVLDSDSSASEHESENDSETLNESDASVWLANKIIFHMG